MYPLNVTFNSRYVPWSRRCPPCTNLCLPSCAAMACRPPLRILVLQAHSASAEPWRNVLRILATIESALASGASFDLLVVPETYLHGYNAGASALQTLAVPLPCSSPTCCATPCGNCKGNPLKIISEAAALHRVSIMVSYAELCVEGADCVHNSCSLFGAADGKCLLHYRKLHLWGPYEKVVFTPGPGKAPCGSCAPRSRASVGSGLNCAFPLAVVPYGPGLEHTITVGALICFDLEFPEAPRTLALAGAEAIIAPVAMGDSWGTSSLRICPLRAMENGCTVVMANYPSGQAPKPADLSWQGVQDMHCGGGSCVVGPNGVPVAALPTYSTAVPGDAARQPQAAWCPPPQQGSAQCEYNTRDRDTMAAIRERLAVCSVPVSLPSLASAALHDLQAIASPICTVGWARLQDDEAVLVATVDVDSAAYKTFQDRNPYMKDRRPDLYCL